MLKFGLTWLRSKVQSQAGESLVEVLVALLISSLGMLMLANTVGTANNIVRQGRVATDIRYAAEAHLSDTASGTGGVNATVTLNSVGNTTFTGNTKQVEVKYIKETIAGNNTIVSYEVTS